MDVCEDFNNALLQGDALRPPVEVGGDPPNPQPLLCKLCIGKFANWCHICLVSKMIGYCVLGLVAQCQQTLKCVWISCSAIIDRWGMPRLLPLREDCYAQSS